MGKFCQISTEYHECLQRFYLKIYVCKTNIMYIIKHIVSISLCFSTRKPFLVYFMTISCDSSKGNIVTSLPLILKPRKSDLYCFAQSLLLNNLYYFK